MYKNSKREGLWKAYYDDKKKFSEGFFRNNKLDGEWIIYYENGQIKRKEIFKNGVRILRLDY